MEVARQGAVVLAGDAGQGRSDMKHQYWVVGASVASGRENSYIEECIRDGYWQEWHEAGQVPTADRHLRSIQPEDRIALKTNLGRKARQIRIRALGIVRRVRGRRLQVNWVTRVNRRAPVWGFIPAIREVKDKGRRNAIFCL